MPDAQHVTLTDWKAPVIKKPKFPSDLFFLKFTLGFLPSEVGCLWVTLGLYFLTFLCEWTVIISAGSGAGV